MAWGSSLVLVSHEQRQCNQRFLWEDFGLIVCEDGFGVGFVREFEIGEP